MNATLRPCCVSEFHRQPDAVNRRREARNKKPPLRVGEYFVKLAAHGALAGRVTLALNVSGILKQREHALLAIFGEGVQVEQMVVGGCGIDLEVAGMNDHAERSVNRQRNAIHQAVRHPNGMDREHARLEAFAGANLTQVGIVEQSMLVEFVFHVGQREFRTPHGNV